MGILAVNLGKYALLGYFHGGHYPPLQDHIFFVIFHLALQSRQVSVILTLCINF